MTLLLFLMTSPQLPDTPQHSPCVLGNQLPKPLRQTTASRRPRTAGRQAPDTLDQDLELRVQASQGPWEKFSFRDTLGSRTWFPECDGPLTRESVSVASEGRASGATSIPPACPGHSLPCLLYSIRALGFQTTYGFVHGTNSWRGGMEALWPNSWLL